VKGSRATVRKTRIGKFVPLVTRLLAHAELVRDAERRIAAAGIVSGTPEIADYLAAFARGDA
jgi:hypothetical protein